jgi:uroporphyrinogen decarboxylase
MAGTMSPITAKENARQIIRFDNPAYVMPRPPVYEIGYLGCNHEGFAGGGHDSPVGTRWVDIWGTEWRKSHAGVMGFPVGNPLAAFDALDSYRWPDPDDPRLRSQIYDMAAAFPGDDRFLGGSHRDTLWEKSYMLVGMENMMTAFFTAPDFARAVLRQIMDFQLGIARHYVRVGVEIVGLSDDLGTQRGPLLGPAIVERFLLPEYARLIGFYKARGVLVNFHSCGNVASVVEMLIDLGVDILNPVQVTANNLDELRARTQGKLALQGGVNSATIMDGPPERIAAEARARIAQLGQDGGYFCCQDQDMPFPPEHITALREAVETFGHYPARA